MHFSFSWYNFSHLPRKSQYQSEFLFSKPRNKVFFLLASWKQFQCGSVIFIKTVLLMSSWHNILFSNINSLFLSVDWYLDWDFFYNYWMFIINNYILAVPRIIQNRSSLMIFFVFFVFFPFNVYVSRCKLMIEHVQQ